MKAGSDLDFVIDSLPWEFAYAMADNVPENVDNYCFDRTFQSQPKRQV